MTVATHRGEAERIMGEAMRQLKEEDPVKWRRSDIMVTTKVYAYSDVESRCH